MSNIIDAIINVINNPIYELRKVYERNNRANNAGDALEEYIKDLFANTLNCNDEVERIKIFSEIFSYLGNDTNPPDCILKNGDAIEVKKIENKNSALALNSSYPKNKLYSSSSMISKSCKECEDWVEKDIIYTVGVVEKNNLRHLCMVYGLDYCADNSLYEKIKTTIKKGIENIPNIELTETKELGKLNKIDPLGITYLRVRGMWGIENPWKVFEYIYQRDFNKDFNFMCIINEEKWHSFSNLNKLIQLSQNNNNLKLSNIKIKNPNNPAKLANAKLITFCI